MRGQAEQEAPQPAEMATLKPLAPGKPAGTASVDIEAPRASQFGNANLPRGLTIKASALVLAAGAVLIGAVFELGGGAPGQLKRGTPFAAAGEGGAKAPPRSGETVAALSDAGAIPLTDITPSAAVKNVSSEEPPIEFGDHASPAKAPPSANLAPTPPGAAQPIAAAFSEPPVAAAAVAAPFVAPPPAAPQSPETKALPKVSVRPDGTPIATATPSATDSGEAAHASGGPLRGAKPAPKGSNDAAGVAQPSTHKLDSPTKLFGKPSARIVVAKTEAAAPGLEVEKATVAAAEPPAASAAPPAPAQQPVASLSHAFSFVVGALGVPAASAPPPVDLTAHTADVAAANTKAGLSAPISVAKTETAAPGAPQPAEQTVAHRAGRAAPDVRTELSAPIVVAKTETAAPGPTSETPPAPAQQPVNSLSHAFGNIVGAFRVPAASAPPPADQNAAGNSGDWALQFPAPKSEAEAKLSAARLNTKYAAALNGAKIGVNKTLVKGETIYALRVTGLSKANAAALCERLKGRDCFIAK
jgi:hypothetical protein